MTVYFLFLAVILLALLPGAVTADEWVGGIPLTTVQTGTVTGDFWMNITPAPDWGLPNVVKTFTLPDAAVAEPGRITWARLYISAYCGHMQNDYAFTITNKFDGNGDGIYEITWAEPGTSSPSMAFPVSYHYIVNGGNDNSAFPGHGTGEPYKMINDHMTRVTSDYFMWYDVTDLISDETVSVNVNTAGSFDGRIKVISLVVAYNDPSSTTETTYWVNQGHDVCSYYVEDNFGYAAVGTTTFDTTGISGIDSALLTIDYMASNNGNYGFPTSDNTFTYSGGSPPIEGTFTNNALDRVADVQGAYSGVDSWDVTSDITGTGEVTFAYSRYFPATGTAAFYKLPLAFLVVKKSSSATAPVAAFSANKTSGTAPLSVSFTDQSTGTVTSYAWTFGDGGTSSLQNPAHTFSSSGTCTVTLTVTGPGGSDTETRTNYITVTEAPVAPVAAFSANKTSGTAPLSVSFTDQSTGTVSSYAWTFGDGGTSSLQNPAHTFSSSGTCTVTLTVTGPGGSDTETRTNYITVSSPASVTIAFSPQSRTFLPGETAEFQIIMDRAPQGLAGYDMVVSLSSPGIAEIVSVAYPSWGTLTHSPELPNQSILLSAVDTDKMIGSGATGILLATISLNGTAAGTTPIVLSSLQLDSDGGDSIQADPTEGQAVVGPAGAPVAAYTTDKTSGTAPLSVVFTDQSTGTITSYAWDFDSDGTPDSSDQNTQHTFEDPGNYTVTLTVTGPAGSDSVTGKIEATSSSGSSPPSAAFSAQPGSGPLPLVVQFTDNSTGLIISYAWDFGDGATSADRNPVHTYADAGTFTAALLVTGPGGTDTATREILAFDPEQYEAPVAAFSSQVTSGTTPLVVQFTDNSTGSITSYAWDFDSDGTIDSTDPNPKYTYFSKGMYNVSLMVSGPGGSDIEVKTNYIIASTPSSITAAFNATPLSGAAPLTVKFTDESKGTVTSWSWDFDNDGMADSSDENPTFTYYDTGTYSVTLTVGGPGVSNTLKKTDFITVAETASDCDLYIGGLPTPIGATIFALEPNTVKIFKVGNNGPESSPETEIELKSSDGFTGRVSIPAIEANDEITAVIIDTTIRSSVNQKVTYTATIDPDNTVLENNEGNNVKTRQAEVRYNGYKGAQFWGGKDDIKTVEVLDLHGDIIHSFGDSAYRSGSFGSGWNKYTVTWAKEQLEVPDDARIREVRLYVPYTWDNGNIAPDRVSVEFNGKTIPYKYWYHDVSNFGAYWDHVYGLLTYNVTDQYKKNAINKVVFNRQGDPLFTKLSMYGFTLAVIYEDPDEPRRVIFLNEGFDLLGASEDDYGTTEEEATGYIRFSGPSIEKSEVKSADLITFVASGAAQELGREGEGNLIVNGRTIAQDVWDYGGAVGADTGEDGTAQVAVDVHDITDYLNENENEIGVQSTEGLTPCMAPIQSFLVLTMFGDADSDTPSGGSSGGYSSGGGSSGGSSSLLSGLSSNSSTNTSANISKGSSQENTVKITTTLNETDVRPVVSRSGESSLNQDAHQESLYGDSQVPDVTPPKKSSIPLFIGGFLVSVSGASALGLFYSFRGIETRHRYLIAAILLILIFAAVFGIFSLGKSISLPAASGSGSSTATISWNAMPVIETIQDTDPTNNAPDYPEDFTARNGLLFVAEGDGSIQLDDLEVRLGTGENTVILTAMMPFPAEGTDPSLSSYFEETGNGDGILTSGEWLMIYADSCLEKAGTGSPPNQKAVRWQPGDTSHSVTVFYGEEVSYSIVDRSRGEVLQDGRLVFIPQS